MNSDWFTNKGYSHKLCEDYVVTDKDFVIVSDGCSSSQHTDIGARILCFAVKDGLRRLLNTETSEEPNYYEFLRSYALGKASSIVASLGLPLTCLDATLLVAFVYRGRVYIYTYGDGYIASTHKDGHKAFTKIEYPKNAPYYPSYKLDAGRDKSYREMVGRVFTVSAYRHSDGVWVDEHCTEAFNGVDAISNIEDMTSILLMTDGVGSFIDKGNAGKPVPDIEILEQITDFKMFQGEFIRRRMNAMMKDFASGAIARQMRGGIATEAKRNIVHYDDVTIGGLSL